MNFLKKWYTYQKERFPVAIYGLYIFCIVFATFCFTSNICTEMVEKEVNNNPPYVSEAYLLNVRQGKELYYEKDYKILISMFIVAFLQFFMVRIIDEFKDYEEDCKYRPYRPVPRGLIKLSELKIVFIICAILQIGITYYINKLSVIFLVIMWIFFLIMSKGFFIKKILDKHILLEVLLDEIMLPILVLFLSTFLFKNFYIRTTGNSSVSYLGMYVNYKGLIPLLLMSYIISWIVEVARKVRCKEDEENGVKTYTAVFGIKKATCLLWGLEVIVTIINVFILNEFICAIIAFTVVSLINIMFIVKKSKFFAKLTELSANIYIMLAYLSLMLLII